MHDLGRFAALKIGKQSRDDDGDDQHDAQVKVVIVRLLSAGSLVAVSWNERNGNEYKTGTLKTVVLKMGQPRHLFSSLRTLFSKEIVDVSKIGTRIVRVSGWLAYHYTTTR